eukprot:2796768-Rhodomonas_salina.1
MAPAPALRSACTCRGSPSLQASSRGGGSSAPVAFASTPRLRSPRSPRCQRRWMQAWRAARTS